MSDTPVTQWQIVTPDPERAAQFYSRVFGWTLKTDNALGYRQIAAQPGGIPGGIWPAPPGAPSSVQVFVSVPDVARAVAEAVAHGATVIVPTTTLPDGDVMAVLADPVGLSFGLMQRQAAS